MREVLLLQYGKSGESIRTLGRHDRWFRGCVALHTRFRVDVKECGAMLSRYSASCCDHCDWVGEVWQLTLRSGLNMELERERIWTERRYGNL